MGLFYIKQQLNVEPTKRYTSNLNSPKFLPKSLFNFINHATKSNCQEFGILITGQWKIRTRNFNLLWQNRNFNHTNKPSNSAVFRILSLSIYKQVKLTIHWTVWLLNHTGKNRWLQLLVVVVMAMVLCVLSKNYEGEFPLSIDQQQDIWETVVDCMVCNRDQAV